MKKFTYLLRCSCAVLQLATVEITVTPQPEL